MQTTNKWAHVSFFFGIFFISFILWNRLIRVRLPRELFITNEYDLIFFIVLLFATLFGLLFLYYFLNLIKYLPKEPGKIIKRVLIVEEKIKNYNFYKFIITFSLSFINGPLNLYNLIYNLYYKKIDKILEFTGDSLVNFFLKKSLRLTVLYITIFVFPRILICVLFFIEVIFYKKLDFFYKILPLILIPTLGKAYFFILQQFCDESMEYYRKFFDIVHLWAGNGMFDLHVYPHKLSDQNQIEIQEYLLQDDKILDLYEFYLNIYIITYQILDERYNKYKNLLFTIYYGIYFLGFFFYTLILLGFY